MFSWFKRGKIDTSTPLRFKESILVKPVDISDLLEPSVFQAWSKKENARQYMEVLEGLAERGNVPSQEFAAHFFAMAVTRTANSGDAQLAMYYKALKFGVLAAESGVDREAQNIPRMALKLLGILTSRNGQRMDKEVQSLVHLAYKWHNRNSANQAFSAEERQRSAQEALRLKDAWPALDEESSESVSDSLEEAMIAITAMILATLGPGAPTAVQANEMAREALQHLAANDIVACDPSVVTLFVLMQVANSAFNDKESATAKLITEKCKPIAKRLMTVPSSEYSDLEFSMIDNSIESMKKIDLV